MLANMYQIGSAFVLGDPYATRSGSGGGSNSYGSGGRGGGAISLKCRSLNLTGALLAADGATSQVIGLGSGSGGSISIVVTNPIVGTTAVLTASGGSAVAAMNIAAGGGGRVYYEVKLATCYCPVISRLFQCMLAVWMFAWLVW